MLFTLDCVGQKHDAIWTLGYGSGFSTTGGFNIDFGQGSVKFDTINRPMDFLGTVGSICDSAGNLLFCCNGEYVADKNDQKMPNGDSLNIAWGAYGYGYPVPQGIIILQQPDTQNIYYIFHICIEFNPVWSTTQIKGSLWYSVVDMTLNNGLGDVVIKNQRIIDGGLIPYSNLTACKHANGKDWWVVVPKKESNGYYKVLFNKKGVELAALQSVGDTIPEYHDGSGMSCFSPDGQKYAFYNTNTDLYLFDFNRCNGELYNFKHIPIHDTCDTYNCTTGIAFSPNSRFLYVSGYFYLYQIDLKPADTPYSIIKLAELDYQLDTNMYLTAFCNPQLAFDKKIYISTSTSSTYYYHVISSPDEPGVDCGFVMRGLQLPRLGGNEIPHFPNYRLGPVSNEYCDSLSVGTKNPVQNSSVAFSLWPNPAHSSFAFSRESAENEGILRLFDANGRLYMTKTISEGANNIQVDVSTLSPGSYVVEFVCEQIIGHKKLVVQ